MKWTNIHISRTATDEMLLHSNPLRSLLNEAWHPSVWKIWRHKEMKCLIVVEITVLLCVCVCGPQCNRRKAEAVVWLLNDEEADTRQSAAVIHLHRVCNLWKGTISISMSSFEILSPADSIRSWWKWEQLQRDSAHGAGRPSTLLLT